MNARTARPSFDSVCTIALQVTVMLAALNIATTAEAQPAGFNYDETKVPPYVLPDPLMMNDGTKVETADQWSARRAELYELFAREMFGQTPDLPVTVDFTIAEDNSDAFEGKVRRRQIDVTLSRNDRSLTVRLLVYTPANSSQPVPTFLGLNFNGNHTIESDPAIAITTAWVSNSNDSGAKDNRASETGRGSASRRWPIAEICEQGFGVATAYYGELDPDFDDGFTNGVHPLLDESVESRNKASWGSIAGWAWGLSRLLDVLEKLDQIEGTQVMVVGHSRLGKTALWAGASDPRFAMVVSNNSGCGGAAISRRRFGETVARINTAFPHWFNDNYLAYNDKEDTATFDQHELIALIAPRPVLITSASEDLWADPKGEFLSGVGAESVYRLLGTNGIATTEPPTAGEAIHSRIGYRMRSGPHDMLLEDWQACMEQARRHVLPEP